MKLSEDNAVKVWVALQNRAPSMPEYEPSRLDIMEEQLTEYLAGLTEPEAGGQCFEAVISPFMEGLYAAAYKGTEPHLRLEWGDAIEVSDMLDELLYRVSRRVALPLAVLKKYASMSRDVSELFARIERAVPS